MLLLALVFSQAVLASEPARSIEIVDPAWGKFSIRLEDAGEPEQAPMRVDLALLCADQRAKPDGSRPAPAILIDHGRICGFERYTFDRTSKVLTVQFTTSRAAGAEAKCQNRRTENFEMKKLCAAWTERNRKKR